MDRLDPITAVGVLSMSIGLIALIYATARKADRVEFVLPLFNLQFGLLFVVSRMVPDDSVLGWAVLLLLGGSMFLTLGVGFRMLKKRNRRQ